MKFVLTCSIILFSFFSRAQHKYDWSKYYTVPFTIEPEIVQSNYEFEKDVLSPIQVSKADIEIRCYQYGHLGRLKIRVVQFFNNSIICKEFDREVYNHQWLPVPKKDSNLYNTSGNYYSWSICQFQTKDSLYLLLESMITKGLFTLNKTDSIKEILKNKYAKVHQSEYKYGFDEISKATLLIKLKNKYRTCLVRTLKYYDINLNTENVNIGWDILEDFSTFFQKNKIKKRNNIIVRSVVY
jgi:hypothetical protein